MSDMPTFEEILVQLRRARWFDYARQRFDLLSFGEIADWFACPPGSFTQDPELRQQILDRLEASVAKGEFPGLPPSERCIPCFQKPPPSGMLGSFCLRLNYAQIVALRDYGAVDGIHLPRAVCAKWLMDRGHNLPPFLAQRGGGLIINGSVEPKSHPALALPSAAKPSNEPQAAASTKNRGGRPPLWNWDAFDREIVRLANTPDGLPERAALQNLMLSWCTTQWGNTPADSAVRAHISRVFPA